MGLEEIQPSATDPRHLLDRSGWRCAACDDPWPCAPAKVQLSEEYRNDRVALVVLMTDYLFEAVTVFLAAPRELHERFIAWTRYPRAGDPPMAQPAGYGHGSSSV